MRTLIFDSFKYTFSTLMLIIITLLLLCFQSCCIAVVNGKIVNGGLYVIQSEFHPRSVITVGKQRLNSSSAGEPLYPVRAEKWMNLERQKWKVTEFGTKFYKIFPVEQTENELTYQFVTEDFPMPNMWQLIGVEGNKYWKIKLFMGNCTTFQSIDERLAMEECTTSGNQLWHFHLLNQ